MLDLVSTPHKIRVSSVGAPHPCETNNFTSGRDTRSNTACSKLLLFQNQLHKLIANVRGGFVIVGVKRVSTLPIGPLHDVNH